MADQAKVAIVTGASQGIGRAIAERLGRDGAKVIVNYFPGNLADAEEVVRAIGDNGGTAVAAAADVAEPAQLRSLFDVAEKEFGGLDIVVHNAGWWRFTTIAESTEEDFDKIFATNTRATFVALRESAARMTDGGRFVAISAGLTLMPRPTTALYAASKAALDHLVRVAAHEFGPQGITVNSVRPGAVNTPAFAANPREYVEDEISRTPLRRIAEPEDISGIVAFLVSADGGWVTGQNISAGGGMF